MDLRDRVEKAKDTAVDTASDAKETVSERANGATETAAETTATTSAVVSTAVGAVSGSAADAGDRVVAGLPDRVSAPSPVGEGGASSASLGRLRSISDERFALPAVRVRPALVRGGSSVAAVARRTDLRRVFRFGKDGFSYGKTFGDYVPVVGSYLPYVGFVTGIGVGVLDDIDVLPAEVIADRSASLSTALERVVRRDGTSPTERPPDDGDHGSGESRADGAREYLEMDFEEFADKR